MSRMVSRYVSNTAQGDVEIQGYMNGKGEIKYSFIRNNRNQGDCTDKLDDLLNDNFWRFNCVFNEEKEAEEEFELLGFLL